MENVTLNQKEQSRLQILNSLLSEHIGLDQAAMLMGVSTPHTRRILAAYREDGAAALAHGNRGRKPANATPDSVIAEVVHLARTRYRGANHTHLSELLGEREGFEIGRVTLRRALTRAGIASPRRRRPPKHRIRRQRMRREGMLVQLDGSHHRWLEDRGSQFTLLLAVDDATGCVSSALFCLEETTHDYFLLIDDLVRRWGVPLSLYTDRPTRRVHTKDQYRTKVPGCNPVHTGDGRVGYRADLRAFASGQGPCGAHGGYVPGQVGHRAASGRSIHRGGGQRSASGLSAALQ